MTQCLLRTSHGPHEWWHTTSGGGHMLDGPDDSGIERNVTGPHLCEGLKTDGEISADAAVEAVNRSVSAQEPFPTPRETAGTGQTLPNGATLVASRPRENAPGRSVVLAIWRSEYVTWERHDATDETYWGHYHDVNFEEAVRDFRNR